MKKTQLYLLAVLIAALGIGAFAYKWQVLRFPVEPVAQTEIWQVQARVEFRARRGPNRVTLKIPSDPPNYAALDEKFIAHGYGVNAMPAGGRERQVQWQIRRASGTQALYYRAIFHRDDHAAVDTTRPPPPPRVIYEEPFATARSALLDNVRNVTVDSASFAGELVRRLWDASPTQDVALLLEGNDADAERVALAISLLAERNIAARVAWALPMAESSNARLRPYFEVYDAQGARWTTVRTPDGQIGWPTDALLWSRGPAPVLEVDGNPRAVVEFSVQRDLADALETAKQRLAVKDRDLVAYSLLNLPLQAQETYRILLLVPLGAFIMLLLRNIVGIKTFGTFMPVLIALAFNWTGLVAGVVLFATIISLGLLVRFYMERLKLLLVPRLTAVLIVVVLLMALVSVVSNRLGIEVGLNAALFPMIILTMTIERVSVAWEERGAGYAIRQALGSLLIASLAYLVMGEPHLQHLIFVFPELLLVLFGLTLVLGRYSGYRLTELFRFRALARDPIAPAPAAPAGTGASPGTGG